MSRPATGQVGRTATAKQGATYTLRFRAYGKRRYLTRRSATTASRAQVELENVLADVRRGIWRAAEPGARRRRGPTSRRSTSSRASGSRRGSRRARGEDDRRLRWSLSNCTCSRSSRRTGSRRSRRRRSTATRRRRRASGQDDREDPRPGREGAASHGLANRSINQTLRDSAQVSRRLSSTGCSCRTRRAGSDAG